MVSYSYFRTIIFGSFILVELVLGNNHFEREKRYIVYPRGGSFKIVIGIGTPVKLGSKQSMAIGWNLQMQYAVPQNSTQLETYPPDYVGTGKRSTDFRDKVSAKSDRATFYGALEEIFDNENLHGRQCLLKSICENAMDPLDHKANGLFGKIFHIVLTPGYGSKEVDPDLDPVYLEAQYAGEYGIKCNSLYSECKLNNGLLDLFTILES